MKLSADAFTERTKLTDASLKSYFKTVKSGEATFTGYKAHVNSAATSTGLLGIKAKITAGAMKTLKVAMGMIGTMLLATVIEKIISGLDSLHKSSKEIAEAAENAKAKINELTDAFETQKSSVNDIKERYAELAQGIDLLTNKNLTLSTEDYEEFLNLNNQLANLFPELTRGIDDNGNEILNLSGDVNTIVGSLDELIKKEKELTDKKILEEMPDAYEGFKKNYDEYNEEIDILERKAEAIQTLKNLDYSVDNTVFKDDAMLKWNLPIGIDETSLMDLESQLRNALNDSGIDSDFMTSYYKDMDTDGYTLTLQMPKVELENNDIKSIIGDYISNVNDDLQIARYELEDETSNFSKYMSVWLSDQSRYKGQSKEVQDALEEMMFSGDWLDEAFKDPDVDPNNWDSLANWFTENYLKAIEKINDEEIKNKLNELFVVDDVQSKLDLAKEIQAYFDKNNINISLDFVLDENDYTSTANLFERVKTKNEEITGLDELKKKYEEVKQARQKLYSDSDYVGNVDINNRPVVTDSSLGGDYQTSYTGFQEFRNEDGNYEIIHFTPILPDGTVLDDNTLYDYFDNVLSKSKNKLEADKVENGGLGILYKVDTTVDGENITDSNINKAFNQAEAWDVSMHERQATIYDEEAQALISYNDALEEHNKLNQYFKNNSINTEGEYNKWLEITDGAENATQAMYLYDQYLRSISNKDVNFFTSDNLGEIDEYKSKISDLSGYLEKINTEYKLSAEDLSNLNLTYGISADTLEEYEQAIIKEMNEAANNSDVMKALAEAIATCDDAIMKSRLEALYVALQNINVEAQKTVTSFEDLGEAVSTLESSASLLRDLNEEKQETGRIDISNSDEILSIFPEMAEDVALFNAGLMKSEELFAKLEQAYQNNADKYADAIKSELQNNEKFYDHIVDNLDDWVLDMAKAYDINLEDYKTLNEEKLALDKEYAKRKAIFDEALLKNEAINDVLQSPESKDFKGKDFRRALNTHEAYLTAQSDLENIQAIIDAIDTTFTTNVSWETFGKDDDSGSDKDNMTEIDWADQSLKVLQDEVDKFQTALDNTKGLENQIDAIDDLNGALKKLKGGYQSAYDEYEQRYVNTVSGLGEDIRKKIESGEEFDLSQYDSDTAESIQNAIDYYNAMIEAGEKIKETSNEIDINEKVEKSKLRQQGYELQLETINTKLEDQTLTADKKTALLDKQLKKQNAINKELRKQAKYEEDFETVSKLNAEDKNNELQNRLDKLQVRNDDRSYRLNDINNNVQDIQNDIDLKGGRGNESQYRNLESLYGSSRNYWVEQKADVEAMRDSFTPFTAEWDKWNNEVQESENNINKCDSSIKDCQMSILRLPLNDVEDALRNIESKLRDINKGLEEQSDLIAAAGVVISNEIETQEVLKEAIQDKIDALERENTLRQSNLAVQKAQYELEKLKNQRSNKVFVEGVGWEYQSDPDEIRDAQYNLDNANYEHKLTLLRDQITVYDLEIERLNKIKDEWSDITTDAENLLLINKALLYDSGFISKVLSGDSGLIDGISSTYSSLLGQKDSYEEQQEDYTTLQDVINDTVEMYDLEAIGYEEAKQRIKNAITQYYPEIVSNYENEEKTLDKVAEKKLNDAGVTEETSASINETVKKENKKLVKQYNKLVEDLDGVFLQLNGMIQTFSSNTQAMVDAISESITALRTQLAEIQSGVDDVTITTETTTEVKASDSKNNKKKNNKNKDVKYHSGLELGYVGEGNASKDKETFKYIALNELRDDEIVRVLQKGEGVVNSYQITQVMDNFRKLAQFKTPMIPLNNMSQNKTISFNGDIIIQNTQNANNLANAIKTQLPNAMLQELYK